MLANMLKERFISARVSECRRVSSSDRDGSKARADWGSRRLVLDLATAICRWLTPPLFRTADTVGADEVHAYGVGSPTVGIVVASWSSASTTPLGRRTRQVRSPPDRRPIGTPRWRDHGGLRFAEAHRTRPEPDLVDRGCRHPLCRRIGAAGNNRTSGN